MHQKTPINHSKDAPKNINRSQQGHVEKHQQKNKEIMQATNTNGAQQGDNASYEQRKNIRLQ